MSIVEVKKIKFEKWYKQCEDLIDKHLISSWNEELKILTIDAPKYIPLDVIKKLIQDYKDVNLELSYLDKGSYQSVFKIKEICNLTNKEVFII